MKTLYDFPNVGLVKIFFVKSERIPDGIASMKLDFPVFVNHTLLYCILYLILWVFQWLEHKGPFLTQIDVFICSSHDLRNIHSLKAR
jgi:hypothetical protein